MAIIVKGDLYEQLDGQLHEIKRQMRQEKGYPFDPQKLKVALQALIEGRFEAVGGQFPAVIHAADLIPEGWTVVEDVEPSEFRVEDLKFVPFLEEGETSISGTTMRERASKIELGNLGLSDLKRVLVEQEKLPQNPQGWWYIAFTGTVLRDPRGGLRVACLYWRVDGWYLRFRWLGGGDWCGRGRLPRGK